MKEISNAVIAQRANVYQPGKKMLMKLRPKFQKQLKKFILQTPVNEKPQPQPKEATINTHITAQKKTAKSPTKINTGCLEINATR